ncbi:MAG: phosphatase PAP2 family protein [Candidatus Gastranaerophilales bacterium]|nr:phosphatase PAP2 family protein [Candidatus Gastranaerophilales bacterium]
MKKAAVIFLIFIIYTLLIVFCPFITDWDRTVIYTVQTCLKDIPITFPSLFDSILYDIMLILPIIFLCIYFIKKKKWFDLIFIALIPVLTYILNCIIKPIIHRVRPPYEMQLGIHPESFSYVSSHSLITFCLWAMVIYYTNKHCKINKVKYFIDVFAVLWILFMGFSRVWLGVHNPTDVLGAYLLGAVLISGIVALRNRL